MNIHGTPLASTLLRDTDAADRFWYWRGHSGRRYIHSVYALPACPPLPGAIYLAVRRGATGPVAIGLGRFPGILDGASADRQRARLAALGANEVHVHLLAKGDQEAETIRADLASVVEPALAAMPGLAA
jgi:hypothetical protein